MCTHEPQCPPAGNTERVAAHVIAARPEQGWSLLCNGIVLFDDGGLLLPDGRAEAPPTQPVRHARPARVIPSGRRRRYRFGVEVLVAAGRLSAAG
jgi:hypothetical protein